MQFPTIFMNIREKLKVFLNNFLDYQESFYLILKYISSETGWNGNSGEEISSIHLHNWH